MFQKSIILNRIRLFFSKEKESYFALYRILGFFPKNIAYYKEALLHKSSTVRSAKGYKLNNERLEFLGDAILDALVADVVYRHFEGKREGFLTNTRSKIVQRETLNKIAVEIGLDKLIKYSSHSTNHNSYMCGNAFEALVGAIYLDLGYDACMYFIQERILHRLINIDKVAYKEVNFKSKLIEWSQKNKVKLEFRLVEQKQEVGSPVFISEVLIEDLVGGSGTGYSKKESQQAAAKQALGRLKKDSEFLDSVFAVKKERNVTVEINDGVSVILEDEDPVIVYKEQDIHLEEDESQTEETETLKKTDSVEQIIAAAEEEAFRGNLK